HLRIGIVTDTCTYGTDIPKLARVIIAHIGDSINDSPEVRKQQLGRPGRDGNPAVALAYAPSWVQDVPQSEITTKQGHADRERRNQLPAVTHAFFNPTVECCSRAADLEYNSEPFVLQPNCCSLHAPEPEQSRDLGMVARWADFFQRQQEANGTAKAKAVRSDGTHPPLDADKHGIGPGCENHTYSRFSRKYQQLQNSSSTGGVATLILPGRLIQRLVERAHVCTSLDRLWGVMDDWKYLALLGADLFEILSKVLPTYSEI
ncbi:hypothetical protein C8R43DRAFT_859731, partial [Mycena crocata]